MKKFYTSLIAFTFILTGCSFLDFLPKGEDGEKDPSKDTITSFDFVTDSKIFLHKGLKEGDVVAISRLGHLSDGCEVVLR